MIQIVVCLKGRDFMSQNKMVGRRSILLKGEVKYLEISEIIEDRMSVHKNIKEPSLEEILETETATYERINSRR